MPQTTVWRALKSLNLHSYCMATVQQLKPYDLNVRRQFCFDELEHITRNSNYSINLIFSDETHFHLNSGINRYNCRIWSVENPRWFEKHPLHSSRVTVWEAISYDKVYGPYFFEGTVTGKSYLDLLQTQILPEIVSKHSSDEFIFIQNMTLLHFSKLVREWLGTILMIAE
uniref:Transposable element Tc3 transposase n=1 Tax=Strongyloides stercoralis TaxID=6248 RepID=A0A0K0E597_STRER